MAYFNYFIKCIIRNIAHKLCKPKVFLTVLLAVAILFVLHSKGYCAWTDGEIEACLDGLATITNNQGVMISQLSSLGVDVSAMQSSLNTIKTTLNNIKVDTNSAVEKLNTIMKDIQTLNTNIINIYNQLESNQQELIEELEQNNNSVVSALEDIKNVLQGNTIMNDIQPQKIDGIILNDNGSVSSYSARSVYYFSYDKNLKYNFECINKNSGAIGFIVCGGNDIPGVGKTYSRIFLTTVSANSSSSYQLNSGYNFKYIVFRFIPDVSYNIQSVEGSVGFDGVQDSINQGNQLQQEQNQLQQEQNDFLKDDNVGVDSSTLPSDTTENITSDGFNSIFQQLYTTFTSGSAQDVVITIPFTNKSFTINAKSVYGGANLGFIKTIIEAFWYFVISYFIVQDIGKKINKIKSGDIEHVQETNIKEDIL